jgi:hypothetical protein
MSRARNICTYVIVANFSSEELTSPKATVLGVAAEISEFVVTGIIGNSVITVSNNIQGNLNRSRAL